MLQPLPIIDHQQLTLLLDVLLGGDVGVGIGVGVVQLLLGAVRVVEDGLRRRQRSKERDPRTYKRN